MGIERQHYVSQGFLKGFKALGAESDKFIWVYEKLNGRCPRRVSIKSIAWESYYYAQETEAGETDTDTLEKKFAETVDNISPKIIRSIEATPGKPVDLKEEDLGALAFFIGISLTRVPSFREGIRDCFSKIAQITLNQVARKDPEILEGIRKYGVKAEAKQWVSLEPMVQIAQQIGQSILEKNWQFFVPPTEHSLITSDNPVIFSVSKEYGQVMAGPAHPFAEIVVNLRSDLALVVTPRKCATDFPVFQMTTQDAKKFNRGIARAARRFVFANHHSDGLERLVKKHIGMEQAIVV